MTRTKADIEKEIKSILDKNGTIEFDAKGLQNFIRVIEQEGRTQMLEKVKEIIEKLKERFKKICKIEGLNYNWVENIINEELLSQLEDDDHSQEIDVEGKPMSQIPPTQKTSGNVTSVTPDTRKGFTDKELYESTLGIPWDRKEKSKLEDDEVKDE